MTLKTNYLRLLSLLLCLVMSTNSFSQDFQWAQAVGGSGWDQGTSIAVDKNNNVYTIGRFKGTVDFDPGTSIFNLTSVDEEDAFILKLDVAGNFIWAKQFGDSAFVDNNAVALDSVGNIYTTGSFLGQVDFNPNAGSFNLTSIGWDRNIFIQKLDANGNFIWAKQLSGASAAPASIPAPVDAYSIAVDAIGSVYITGYFDGTVDFDPDIDSTFYLSAIPGSNIYINKLDSDGNFVWAKGFGGGQGGGVGYAITVDENGNVYSTGTIGGVVDFDPGIGVFNLGGSSSFQSEIYVSKLDALGNFVWAKSMGIGEGSSIAVDQNGQVYASGWFPNGTTAVLNKLDPSGHLIWAKALGGLNGKAIALDNSGHVYTTGSCFGTNDFDPGLGVFNLTAGNGDVFISKLDTAGHFIWAGLLMSTSQITPNSMVIDLNDNVYTTGFFDGTTDFDPASTTFNLSTPIHSYNLFVHKLSPNISLGLVETSFETAVKIYPNPTGGNLIVELNERQASLTLVLKNMIGQEIDTKVVKDSHRVEMQINGAPGIYLLEILNEKNQRTIIEIIKK